MSFPVLDPNAPLPVGSVPNDYRTVPGRWLGPNCSRRPAMSQAALTALADAARANGGSPLSDKQRAEILERFK